MDAIHCLKTRRSIRSFAPGEVDPEIVDDLIDCARLAPTAMNKQPWTFVVIRDEATRHRIVGIAGHGEFFRAAPVGIAVCCEEWDYWKEDGSTAAMSLLLAAHAHGLGAVWLSMEPHAYAGEVKALLGIPAGVHLLAIIVLGPPAESPVVEKKALADVTRHERWA